MNYILRAAATPRVSALPNPTIAEINNELSASHQLASSYPRDNPTNDISKKMTTKAPTAEYAKAHITNITFNHVGFSSDSGASAGGTGRDRVDAALPQLPQKSASGLSFPPHFLQNMITLSLPVYASQPFEVLAIY